VLVEQIEGAAPNNGTHDLTIPLPFNPDGFNLSGHNTTLDGHHSHIDGDCACVISGAQNIVVNNEPRKVSSHGTSIDIFGGNGANHTVANILFQNWTYQGRAIYAARIFDIPDRFHVPGELF
jgi:hypothetical protein